MKIAITGHTSGIGQALYNHCIQQGHDCVGLSRSTGNNIAEVHDILQLVNNVDVFVNNAYHQMYQVDLFNNWYAEHQHHAKTIVNVGSLVQYSGAGHGFPPLYVACKKELDKVTRKAKADTDRVCRIINFVPGAVDTKMPTVNRPLLDTQACAEIMYWAISQPHHIEIGNLSVQSIR